MVNVDSCKYCGSANLVVTDSRIMANGCRRRVRKCLDCKKHLHTVEMDRDDYEIVEKKRQDIRDLIKMLNEVANGKL